MHFPNASFKFHQQCMHSNFLHSHQKLVWIVWIVFLLQLCSVMPDSLRPHALQHARLPCPSPTTRACSNSCPLSRWCHPTILSSVIPFSSCLPSFLASSSFKKVSSSYQAAKALEFLLQHQSFQWVFGTAFFRIDLFDLLAVQGTFKSLIQHHS